MKLSNYTRIIGLGIVASIFSISASAQLSDVLKISLDGAGFHDEMVVRFIDGATENFDGSFDAYKLYSANTTDPEMYSTINGMELSINALPKLNQDFNVQFNTLIATEDVFTFTPSILGAFEANVEIFLVDEKEGIGWKVIDNQPITLTIPASLDSAPRFELIFSTPTALSTIDATCFGSTDGEVVITDLGNTSLDYTILDEDGNTVYTGFNVNEVDYVDGLTAGNYTLVTIDPVGDAHTTDFLINEPGEILATFATNLNTVMLSEGGIVEFYNFSTGATSYLWEFGDGNQSVEAEPVNAFEEEGTFEVILTAIDGGCSNSANVSVSVINDLSTTSTTDIYEDYATPAIYSTGSGGYVQTNHDNAENVSIDVYNLQGQIVNAIADNGSSSKLYKIDIADQSTGIYIVKVQMGDEVYSKKVFLSK